MIEAVKVVYQVFMQQRDEHGNVVDEVHTDTPLVLYAHKLTDLPAEVARVVAQAETQAASENNAATPHNRPKR